MNNLNQEENKDTFVALIKEDKNYVKSIRFDSGEIVQDNLILRIYKQSNGKIAATISTRSETPGYIEDIVFHQKGLEMELNVYTLLDAMESINSV